MARAMTERAAWAKLARVWDRPVKTGGWLGWVKGVLAGETHHGLCAAVDTLQRKSAIEARVAGRMRAKIAREVARRQNGTVWGYGWPLDATGAKARAAFCRRQAAKLAKGGR